MSVRTTTFFSVQGVYGTEGLMVVISWMSLFEFHSVAGKDVADCGV